MRKVCAVYSAELLLRGVWLAGISFSKDSSMDPREDSCNLLEVRGVVPLLEVTHLTCVCLNLSQLFSNGEPRPLSSCRAALAISDVERAGGGGGADAARGR